MLLNAGHSGLVLSGHSSMGYGATHSQQLSLLWLVHTDILELYLLAYWLGCVVLRPSYLYLGFVSLKTPLVIFSIMRKGEHL
ncbi:hypothetical protein D3C85_820340 [compost metagenome]